MQEAGNGGGGGGGGWEWARKFGQKAVWVETRLLVACRDLVHKHHWG